MRQLLLLGILAASLLVAGCGAGKEEGGAAGRPIQEGDYTAQPGPPSGQAAPR